MSLRPARPAESQLLVEICLDADRAFSEAGIDSLAEDPFPIEVLDEAIPDGNVTVATDDHDTPIGWLLVSHAGSEPCIAQIAVLRAHGRRGVGSSLLEHAIDELTRAGHDSVVLDTARDLPWNAPWYRRHGFEVVDPSDWTDDMRTITAGQQQMGLDWSTRVHMRRQLQASG